MSDSTNYPTNPPSPPQNPPERVYGPQADPAEVAAAAAALSAGMAASAQHRAWSEAALGVEAGGVAVEQPSTVDGVAVDWPESSG